MDTLRLSFHIVRCAYTHFLCVYLNKITAWTLQAEIWKYLISKSISYSRMSTKIQYQEFTCDLNAALMNSQAPLHQEEI